MEYGYNDHGLSKHKVSRLDVIEVLSLANITTREFDMPLGVNGNLRIMFVGYNSAGRLLEIGAVRVKDKHE